MKKFMQYVVTGATWRQVVTAIAGGMHNMPPAALDELDLLSKQINDPDEQGVVALSTHAIIGEDPDNIESFDGYWGGRSWTPADGVDRSSVPFVEDPYHTGRWDVLNSVAAKELWLQSATSGSTIHAERRGGGWTVTLTVPVIDGEAYQGHYWRTFHEVFATVDA